MTTSGSVQSHMSTSLSKKRLRAQSYHDLETSGPPLPVTAFRPTRRFSALIGYRDGWNTFIWLWNSLSNIYLRWTIALYVGFSLILVTSSLYSLITNGRTPEERYPLSSSRRLSRLVSYYPPLTDFQPFFLRGSSQSNLELPTACVWSGADIDTSLLVEWIRQWNGPVSLLLLNPGVTSSSSLVTTLKALSNLSVHHLHTSFDIPPNVLLNLARLHALTMTVALFPAPLTFQLPPQVRPAILDHLGLNKHLPAVLAATQNLSFPAPSYSPLILRRDDSAWCTERSFFIHSRSLDWEECLWKAWLEDRGQLGHINVTAPSAPSTMAETSLRDKTRTRLTARYRSESCDLSLKQQSILEPASSGQGRRKLQWLKNFCKHTTESIYKIP